MDPVARPEIKYLPRHCAFLNRQVWAILTKQADGNWKIVNCLDKEGGCFALECLFTTDGGSWPFEAGETANGKASQASRPGWCAKDEG